jgi:hypothetical protein
MNRDINMSALVVPVLALLAILTLPAHATGPTYTLPDGSPVTVDPQTRRATVTRGGASSPLWDGTHHMQDGTTVIIRDGVAVVPGGLPQEPNQLQPPRKDTAETWVGAPIGGYSPCERLARAVCGREDQCADAEDCNMAQQLLDMEQKERAAAENPNRMTYTSGQCQEAWPDRKQFPECSR